MRPRMLYDDVSWEDSERIEAEWKKSLWAPDMMWAIARFIAKHRQGVAEELCAPRAGMFNLIFRLKFEDGGSVIVRFPKAGTTMFPEEKMRYEVATMRYIQENTAIPVPFVLHFGTGEESPAGLGPFMIMDYVEHTMDMVDVLNKPELSDDERQCLNPNIDLARLESAYRNMAEILLQLSRLEFPLIGSLQQIPSDDDFSCEVQQHRPLSVHLNELVRLGSIPRAKLIQSTFSSSREYLARLAQLHLDHLTSQRNDAVESREDCQRKYVARCLFRKLARDGKLTLKSHDKGPFKLWCDDLRPANTLLNAAAEVSAVIDWEFTYAAPVEFTFAPPWWLLLEQVEYWPEGLDDWERTFAGRLDIFLRVLRGVEDGFIQAERLTDEQRISDRMRQSWDTGDFWVVYAARKNFAFDYIFWHRIDGRFFGPLPEGHDPETAWRARVDLLSEQERGDMQAFVDKKMAERETRVLQWEPDELPIL